LDLYLVNPALEPVHNGTYINIHPPRPVALFPLVLPLHRHIPSEYKYTDTSQPELFFLYLPRKMELIEGSETSAFKSQTPGKYPKKTYYIKNTAEA
jgi:hypothetical protein